MKLFFSPGACALHAQIAMREAGLDFELVRVDLRAHTFGEGADFYGVNPKGYIPVLELDDGTRLTEGAVIVQFIADKRPAAGMLPPGGTLERVRVQEWLHFIATEIHKPFLPLFNPRASDETKAPLRAKLELRFDYVERSLGSGPFFLGETFTVADGYLFNMLRWAQVVGMDLARWPRITALYAGVESRPTVRASIEAEGWRPS